MSRPCHVLRVFTRGDEGGNHLGVINDVVGISYEDKQRIATELGFSETIYIDWVDGERDPEVTIFTPANELPFAGHPLVGAAWVLYMLGPRPTGRLRTKVGDVGYTMEGDVVAVDASIPILHLDDVTALRASEAGMPPPVRTMCLGLPADYLMAEYESFDDIASLDPDDGPLMQHHGLYTFARDDDTVKGRFFFPSSGVREDPATGSAAVALAHYYSVLGETSGALTIHQGDEIENPSTIALLWDPTGTRIGGTVRRDNVLLVK